MLKLTFCLFAVSYYAKNDDSLYLVPKRMAKIEPNFWYFTVLTALQIKETAVVSWAPNEICYFL